MKLVQIRNVPDDVHRALKERAAREGTTMSDLLLEELPRIAKGRSPQAVLTALRDREPVGGTPPADLIRAERDAR